MKNVLLVNDCSGNRHFGSKMVTEAFRMNVESRGHTLKTLGRGGILPSEGDLEWADVILLNAEGCIHDGKYEELLSIGRRHPNVTLMNGSMQNLSRHFGAELDAFKRVTVRESYSAAELAIAHGFEAEVVPDVIYSLPTLFEHRQGLFVADSSDRQYRKERNCAVTDPSFVHQLATSQSACVGRYHAAVLCTMWGTPFTAFGANTHKLRGLMLDCGLDDLYFEDADDAFRATPRKADLAYSLDAAERIGELFREVLG